MASQRINRKELMAFHLGLDYAEIDWYQEGRGLMKVFATGNDYYCPCGPRENPPNDMDLTWAEESLALPQRYPGWRMYHARA